MKRAASVVLFIVCSLVSTLWVLELGKEAGQRRAEFRYVIVEESY
jgi:hypothetical protein